MWLSRESKVLGSGRVETNTSWGTCDYSRKSTRQGLIQNNVCMCLAQEEPRKLTLMGFFSPLYATINSAGPLKTSRGPAQSHSVESWKTAAVM